ncbi:MAG: hypothetical protein JWQ71_1491 [Pedosphaera sp.]|nr:hypothetical protein [Pedosphaera sp.]
MVFGDERHAIQKGEMCLQKHTSHGHRHGLEVDAHGTRKTGSIMVSRLANAPTSLAEAALTAIRAGVAIIIIRRKQHEKKIL